MFEAPSIDALHEGLIRAARELAFERFALALEIGPGSAAGTSVLLHDYPAQWADVYIGFDLARADPVRRAAERSFVGFTWNQIRSLVPMTELERTTMETARRHGLVDGYTVPRHLPGAVIGSCSFVTGPSEALPKYNLVVAEALGAIAIARASELAGWTRRPKPPRLTERQCTMLLWAARGKTDAEIAEIEGIAHHTATQHMKDAKVRYQTSRREMLILYGLFDGLISFADIFRWRGQT